MNLREFINAYFASEPEYCITFTKDTWSPKTSPIDFCKNFGGSIIYHDVYKPHEDKDHEIVIPTKGSMKNFTDYRQCCNYFNSTDIL